MNLTTDQNAGVAIVRVGESRLMYPLLADFSGAVFSGATAPVGFAAAPVGFAAAGSTVPRLNGHSALSRERTEPSAWSNRYLRCTRSRSSKNGSRSTGPSRVG